MRNAACDKKALRFLVTASIRASSRSSIVTWTRCAFPCGGSNGTVATMAFFRSTQSSCACRMVSTVRGFGTLTPFSRIPSTYSASASAAFRKASSLFLPADTHPGKCGQVPCESPDWSHASCIPDIVWPVSRFPPDFSRRWEATPVLMSSTFTTAAFDRRSSWLFEASPYRTAPKGPPSSFAQHDAFRVFLTQPPTPPDVRFSASGG